jgi:hypothetical protein
MPHTTTVSGVSSFTIARDNHRKIWSARIDQMTSDGHARIVLVVIDSYTLFRSAGVDGADSARRAHR